MFSRIIVLAFCSSLGWLTPAGLAQQTSAIFDLPVLVVPDAQQRMNALLDLNGDDHMDAVGYFWKRSDTFGVFGFVNDAQGSLDPAFEVTFTEYGTNNYRTGLDVADFNQDGLDDFALVVRDRLRIYLSNGAAAPTMAHQLDLAGAGGEGQDLVIGDFDDNGALDAAVLTNQEIQLYTNLVAAPAIFASIPVPLFAGDSLTLKKAECNGDGIDDLMLTGRRVDFFSMASGALAAAGSYFLNLSNPLPAVGDVDGDLDEDVVIFDMGGIYRILRRTRPASYVLETARTGGPATDLADVNGDGSLDGVCCGGGGGPYTYFNNSLTNFEIALNDGSGGFAGSFQLPSLGANQIAGVNDIDQDGDADLIAGRVITYNVRGFHPRQAYVDGPRTAGLRTLIDVDGDGDLDNLFDPDGFVRNLADGSFEVAAHVEAAAPPGTSFQGPGFPGDFDGDGDQDLIVEHWGPGFLGLRLLSNNGAGGLRDSGPAAGAGIHMTDYVLPESAIAADFTGDGVDDLLIQSRAADLPVWTRLWINDGAGFFSPHFWTHGEKHHYIGDLDGNGFHDLVSLGTTVYLRRGYGNGTFGAPEALMPPPSVPFMANSDLMTAGDYDGDGDTDLAVVLPGLPGGSARLLENDGTGTFTLRDNLLPEYQGGSRIFTGDLNADGLDDLVLGPVVGATATYAAFVQTPDPGLTFESRGAQVGGVSALADVDDDGDDDAVYQTVAFNQTLDREDSGGSTQYGPATAGQGGQQPVFGARGPFTAGATAEIRVTGVRPNTLAFLFIGAERASLPNTPRLGTTLCVTPVLAVLAIPVVPGDPAEPGSGRLTFQYTVSPQTAGSFWRHQIFAADPAAPGGASCSSGLEIYYAP